MSRQLEAYMLFTSAATTTCMYAYYVENVRNFELI